MIQNYLKTGMVFYDAAIKQHFKSGCCKETFCQYTDKYHFPSFQIEHSFNIIQWAIKDLDGVTVATWGADTPPVTVYHITDGRYVTSHDFRDVVIYPAAIEYGTCYYIQILVQRSDCAVGKFMNSEAFKVCDCDTEGAGDGFNLIENGCFADWDGAGDPANFPIGWTRTGNNATNYVHDAGGVCQLISSAPLNPILILQDILTIGKWYVFTFEITNVTLGWIRIRNAGVTLAPYNTIGIKSLVFQAAGTDITIRENGACNITFTDARVEEFIGFKFCDMLTLNWWADCDWDDIIYQLGYRNSLVLNTGLDNPSEDIVINPEERQGEMFVRDVIIKKRYKFTIRIPEYLWNALIRLPAYGSEMPNFHAWIVLPDGSTAPMSEVAIMGDWDTGNCMNTFTIDFVDNHEYPVVATNCCADEDYSEI